MNLKRRRVLDMLRRVREFGVARSTAFSRDTLGARMFEVVAGVVRELDARAVEQHGAGIHQRTRTKAKGDARSALRAHLQTIHHTARALAIDAPRIDRRFRPPKSRCDSALLAASHACSRHARRSHAAFVAHGMPPAFVDELKAAITQFEQAISDRVGAKSAMKQVFANIDAAVRRAQVAVRRLDVIVPNTLRRDGDALAAWKRARRVARSGRAAFRAA